MRFSTSLLLGLSYAVITNHAQDTDNEGVTQSIITSAAASLKDGLKEINQGYINEGYELEQKEKHHKVDSKVGKLRAKIAELKIKKIELEAANKKLKDDKERCVKPKIIKEKVKSGKKGGKKSSDDDDDEDDEDEDDSDDEE